MDIKKLRRHESIRGVADRVTEVCSGAVETVVGAVEEFAEQQESQRQEKAAETLGERAKLDVQARDINTLNGRISTDEPIIILGELDAQSGSHVAAVVSTRLSQVKSGHEDEGNLPHIAFYQINETELADLQQNPFKRYHQAAGVVAIGEYMEGESALGWASASSIEAGIEQRVPQIPKPLVGPLGALAVTFEAGIAQKGMQNFEQSLDALRSAMYKRDLNPELAKLLSEPAPSS